MDRRNLAVVPPGVDDATAVSLPVAGLTALHAVRQLGTAVPGAAVAITGATGGVGHLAVQLAVRAGFSVLALTRDAAHASRFPWPAGDHGVRLTGNEHVGELRRLHRVIDSVGGPLLADLARVVLPDTTIVLVGAASGDPVVLDTAPLIARRVDLVSVRIPTPVGKDLMELLHLVSTGGLRVTAEHRGGWEHLVTDPAPRLPEVGKAVYQVTSDRW
ncbi:zinc-binding dehydrogenase [Streptomyces sp. NPDC004980]